MTFEEFVELAEKSPFVWEIFGEFNTLMSEGYLAEDAMGVALEYGMRLEEEALSYERKLKNESK